MTGAASGHVLRVSVQGDHVVLRVDCHQPADADCRTVTGGCLVAEQADDAISFADHHDGPDGEPLADGMRIVARWSPADECYWWHGDLDEAGWVLVPGPVHIQWGQDIHGEVWPRKDEADALAFAAADASDIRIRQVTAWRPAVSTQESDST